MENAGFSELTKSEQFQNDFHWRPILFQFHSDSGPKLLSLFRHLKKNNYHIALCAGNETTGFTCVAAREIPDNTDVMMRLPVDMRILADKFDVRFKGMKKVELKNTG
ncbi:MAG: hypothetical protein EA360_04640 [Balneolaceae bacterium]|nr:MAG: hypothetical protein EA360_04640 [Balneolaceae bacterium]